MLNRFIKTVIDWAEGIGYDFSPEQGQSKGDSTRDFSPQQVLNFGKCINAPDYLPNFNIHKMGGVIIHEEGAILTGMKTMVPRPN